MAETIKVRCGVTCAKCGGCTGHTTDGERFHCDPSCSCDREHRPPVCGASLTAMARGPHSCSNCGGVDPDTCLMNPDRQSTLREPAEKVACPVCDDGLACSCYTAGIAQVDQHGDLKALITDGRHMYRILEAIQEATAGMDDDELAGIVADIPSALHEWEKRAQRAGVDWWNR
jgi:hypothetical protein